MAELVYARDLKSLDYTQNLTGSTPVSLTIYFSVGASMTSFEHFAKPLVVTPVTGQAWKLVEPFEYWISRNEVVEVPAGAMTDFASIPRIFWAFLPPYWTYGRAAVIHDYLYMQDDHIYSRKEVDGIFLQGMLDLGVNKWKRTLMYGCVRVFGAIHWYRRRWFGSKASWEPK